MASTQYHQRLVRLESSRKAQPQKFSLAAHWGMTEQELADFESAHDWLKAHGYDPNTQPHPDMNETQRRALRLFIEAQDMF